MKTELNFNLQDYNAYRLQSVCAKAYFPDSETDLVEIFSKLDLKKFVVLGNGNNIILAKEHYDQAFIILNGCLDDVEVKNRIVVASSGATLLQLSEVALQYQLTGMEPFFDIPSSVGGAVVMNAGNKDAEIKDILLKVRYLDLKDLQIKEKSRSEIDFEYRNSFFQQNANNIVLKAWFKLSKGNAQEIQKKMQVGKDIRWLKQPRDYPNCGSVFKRPKERFVGPMLDELGLKGFAIGGARVSEKHSGFIINTDNATGKDIIALIEEVKRQVKKRYDVELEVEQRVIV